jgi:hypothetical protein
MTRRRTKSTFFAFGTIAGLLLGTTIVLSSALILNQQHDRNALPWFTGPTIPVYASATDNDGSLAVATGAIDSDIEGLYFLDPLTGEMSCYVINKIKTRAGYKFSAVFRYKNVFQDIGLEKGKNAKLLMVTGGANLRGATKTVRPANSIVYVVNSATGQFAAYTVPWSTVILTEESYEGEMVLLDKGKARTAQVRPS